MVPNGRVTVICDFLSFHRFLSPSLFLSSLAANIVAPTTNPPHVVASLSPRTVHFVVAVAVAVSVLADKRREKGSSLPPLADERLQRGCRQRRQLWRGQHAATAMLTFQIWNERGRALSLFSLGIARATTRDGDDDCAATTASGSTVARKKRREEEERKKLYGQPPPNNPLEQFLKFEGPKVYIRNFRDQIGIYFILETRTTKNIHFKTLDSK